MSWSLLSYNSKASTDTYVVTPTAINTTGADDLFVAAVTYNAVSAPSISDSAGNTWTLDKQVSDATSTTFLTLWRCSSPTTSSSHTITVQVDAGATACYPAAGFAAFSGADGDTFDVVNNHNDVYASNFSCGSVTPNQNNSLVLALAAGVSGPSEIYSAASPMTILASVSFNPGVNFGLAFSYEFQGTAGAINPNFTTLGSSGAWQGISIVYKPASTGTTVNLSGASSTTASGTIAKTILPTISGAASTASGGAIAPTTSETFGLTGTAAAAGAGSIAKTVAKTITGASASTAGGSVAITSAETETLSGAAATAASGLISSGANQNVGLNGTASTTTAGAITSTISIGLVGASVSGVAGGIVAVPVVGLLGATASVAVGGLSPSTAEVIAVTGSAVSSAVGPVGALAGTVASLAGATSTTVAGAIAHSTTETFAVSGTAATATAGSISAAVGVSVAITGASATSAAGTIAHSSALTETLPGSSATVSPGNISTGQVATANVVGAAAAATAGSLSDIVLAPLQGSNAATSAGAIGITTAATFIMPGIGLVTFAGPIVRAGGTANILLDGIELLSSAGIIIARAAIGHVVRLHGQRSSIALTGREAIVALSGNLA